MDRIISEYPLPFGCVIRTYETRTPAFSFQAMTDGADGFADDMQSLLDKAPPTMVMTSGYNASGHYIGSEETTKYLVEERGISPETILALITPDAMAALEAVKAEARKEGMREAAEIARLVGVESGVGAIGCAIRRAILTAMEGGKQ